MTDEQLQDLVHRTFEANMLGDTAAQLGTSTEIGGLSHKDLVGCHAASWVAVAALANRPKARQAAEVFSAHLLRRLETGERLVTR